MSVNCPTCGQPWSGAKGRICFTCKKPMSINDKWHIVGSTIQHKSCSNPTLADTSEEVRVAEPDQAVLPMVSA